MEIDQKRSGNFFCSKSASWDACFLYPLGRAIFTLAIIFIPQPNASKEAQEGKGSIWKETLMVGWRIPDGCFQSDHQ